MGVLTTGWCEIGEVRVKVLATLRTVMLRIRDHEIPWTPEVEIAQVVQRPLKPRFKGSWPCEGIFAQVECTPMLSW
jgi:hypothetical protein